jgi:chorismate synthase
MGNSSGSLFRITSFGESHGPALGVVIDGCPAGLRLDLARVQEELDRRRPGASPLASPRKEPDRVELLSGVDGGLTLGSPIALLVRNLDARPADYEPGLYRPGHADLSHELRTGQRPGSGGGRASARETVARVAAGAVARQVLEALVGPSLEILAWVEQVGEERAACGRPSRPEIEQSPVRCPQPEASARMEARIRAVRAQGDSLGG